MKISDKYAFYDKSDIEVVSRIIKNKKLSGTSPVVLEYEKRLSIFFNSKYSVAVSSGTSAIQVALYALGVKNGDEVIVSSACPSMSIVSIIALGAKPIFCDTCEDNFGLDISDLVKTISKKQRL